MNSNQKNKGRFHTKLTNMKIHVQYLVNIDDIQVGAKARNWIKGNPYIALKTLPYDRWRTSILINSIYNALQTENAEMEI